MTPRSRNAAISAGGRCPPLHALTLAAALTVLSGGRGFDVVCRMTADLLRRGACLPDRDGLVNSAVIE
jgi:hypothetical protein